MRVEVTLELFRRYDPIWGHLSETLHVAGFHKEIHRTCSGHHSALNVITADWLQRGYQIIGEKVSAALCHMIMESAKVS